MSDAATSALMESGLEKGGRYAVLMSLAHYLRPQDPGDPKGHRPDEVSVSISTLANFSRVSNKQASRILKQLQDDQMIKLIHKGGSGPGDSNIYKMTCLDLIETVGFANKKARRAIFAGVAKAIEGADLTGAPATLENAAKMIQAVATAVFQEGNEKLGKNILRMITDFHPDADGFLENKGDMVSPLAKGDICDLRGTFATAKGDIYDQNYLLEDSLENPIARASAREAWEQILKFFESKMLLEKFLNWTEGVTLDRGHFAKRGEVLIVNFEKQFDADRCTQEFQTEIQEATQTWSGWLMLKTKTARVATFGGRGSISFDDMAQDRITRESGEDAA